jgi:hypothetical protein
VLFLLVAAPRCTSDQRIAPPAGVASSQPVISISPISPPVVSASSSAAPMHPGALAPATRAPTAGWVACGSSDCQVGAEHCCTINKSDGTMSKQYCEKNLLHADAGCDSHLCQMYCEQTDQQSESFAAAECDDSSDCPSGLCCITYPWSAETHFLRCEPAADRTKNVCETAEACVPGSACNTERTRCEDGSCSAISTVQCGNVRCGGATPICCMAATGVQGKCVVNAQECRASGVESWAAQCATGEDCGKGQSCCTSLKETFCRGECRGGVQVPLCKANADCEPGFVCRAAAELFDDKASKTGLRLKTCCQAGVKECQTY